MDTFLIDFCVSLSIPRRPLLWLSNKITALLHFIPTHPQSGTHPYLVTEVPLLPTKASPSLSLQAPLPSATLYGSLALDH